MRHLSIVALLFAMTVCDPLHAITVNLANLQHSACVGSTGAIDIWVQGGISPYSFQWNNGATTEDLVNLAPGTYSVTVTDANSDQAFGQWTVAVAPLSCPPSAQDGHASCVGSMSGEVQSIEWGINGTPPYTYNPPPDGYDPQGDPYFAFFGTPAGNTVTIEVTDANGCTGILYETIIGPQLSGGPNMVVSNLQGSCTSGAGGAVTISNINDGSFIGNPSYNLSDAAQVSYGSGFSAPNSLSFTGLPPGEYFFSRDWDPLGYIMAYPCEGNPYDQVSFTIPDLGPDCGSVSGTVFIDNDQDCVQDPGEVGVPYAVLQVTPGAQYTITDEDGAYSIDLTNGAYSLVQSDSSLIQLCPVTAPAPFSINYNAVTIHLADSSTVPLDLSAQLESTVMRPGFTGTYWGQIRNLSPQVSGPATISLVIDAGLVLVNASPSPTSIVGNTLTWQLGAFTALQQTGFTVLVQVPATMFLGTPITSTLTVVNTLGDAEPANDQATADQLAVGSYDPNDKTARTSSRSSESLYFLGLDEWIDYPIRFQNTGTDTAFTVVITDTLASELDLSTFQQGGASHPFSVGFKPERVVEWRFTDILLPDSNLNEAASHGMVSFRIRPAQNMVAGTVLVNTANIFFDFNDPVITEPSVLLAEMSTEISAGADEDGMLAPNPTSDRLRITSQEGLALIRVCTMDGRELIRRSAMSTTGEIDVIGLSPGGYFLIATTINGGEVRKRFVKQ